MLGEIPSGPRDWVLNANDLPKVEDLLVVTNPEDDSRWGERPRFLLLEAATTGRSGIDRRRAS